MVCPERKQRGRPADCREALSMAGRLLSLAGLRPDEDARALVVATAPRTVRESQGGPAPRRSFCAYCLCAADEAARLAGRDAELFELAGYFLERLPRLPPPRRRALDRAVAGGAP